MTVTTSIGIGLILSFLYTEITGLLGGGLIVPGYLSLYLDQPARIVATLALALATYAIVWALSRFLIIYGRRRFMANVLVAFWLGWLMSRFGFAMRLPLPNAEFRAVGYIIPGLIANDINRQGIARTFASVLLLAAATRLLVVLVR